MIKKVAASSNVTELSLSKFKRLQNKSCRSLKYGRGVGSNINHNQSRDMDQLKFSGDLMYKEVELFHWNNFKCQRGIVKSKFYLIC